MGIQACSCRRTAPEAAGGGGGGEGRTVVAVGGGGDAVATSAESLGRHQHLVRDEGDGDEARDADVRLDQGNQVIDGGVGVGVERSRERRAVDDAVGGEVGCAWRIGAGGVGVADALGMDGAAKPRLRASGSWPEVLHLDAFVRLHGAQGGDGVDASRRGDPRHRLELPAGGRRGAFTAGQSPREERC